MLLIERFQRELYMCWHCIRNLHFPVFFIIFISQLSSAAPAYGELSITVLYDNAPFKEGLTPDYGFSCLIKAGKKNILFDTGKDGSILFLNSDQLGIDLKKIDLIIASHLHQDHIGGLFPLLEIQPKAAVFLPESTLELNQQFLERGNKVIIVDHPMQIDKGIFLTGALGQGMKEQSLIINAPSGLIIVAGCSHPGILNIIKRSKELLNRPVFLVIAGFHSMPQTIEGLSAAISQFKLLGVKNVGPAHCTSEQTKAFLKTAYGKNYITIGVGKTLNFSSEKKRKK